MSLHKWFMPHRDTHKKAHLLSLEALFIYVLFFVLLQVGFSIVSYFKPGVLGISSNIDVKGVIDLTNKEREQNGLPDLKENSALDKAAIMKAQNMFAENYWAHFAPSGKTPWDFILGSGYKFSYAGENLAKNFYTSKDVVDAWMNSPTHRDNLLNSHYQDIGIAVVDGVLNGQKTTLVVQEFGSTENYTATPTVNAGGKQAAVPVNEYNNAPQLAVSAQTPITVKPLVDPFQASKTAGIGIISLLTILLLLDFIILKRRGVFRIGSHHIAHMALLATAATMISGAMPGNIL